MMSPSDRFVVAVHHLRRELGRLEAQAASRAWPWDAKRSRRMDALCVRIEESRA
jgi:hypothetical protein